MSKNKTKTNIQTKKTKQTKEQPIKLTYTPSSLHTAVHQNTLSY